MDNPELAKPIQNQPEPTFSLEEKQAVPLAYRQIFSHLDSIFGELQSLGLSDFIHHRLSAEQRSLLEALEPAFASPGVALTAERKNDLELYAAVSMLTPEEQAWLTVGGPQKNMVGIHEITTPVAVLQMVQKIKNERAKIQPHGMFGEGLDHL